MSRVKIHIERKELVDLYIGRRLSMAKIAVLFNTNSVTILNRLKEYKIPSRSISQALRGVIPWNKGRQLSQGAKKLIGERFKKLWQNPEFIKKMEARNRTLSENMKISNPMRDKSVSEKVRQKLIGRWVGDKNPMSNIEIRNKVSKILKGHKLSNDTKKKISKSLLGRFEGKKNPFFGKKHTQEVKEKSRIRAIQQLASGIFKNKTTSIELNLEKELFRRNVKYIKQFPLAKITVVDFYLPEHKIVIYADGEFWHKSDWARKQGTIKKDEKQNKVLAENGYKVFRFSEAEISRSAQMCIDKVTSFIGTNN